MPWKFCTEYSWACTQMMFSFNLAPPQLSVCTSLYHSVSPLGLLPPTSPVITLHQSSGHPVHFSPRSILSLLSLSTSTANPCCTLCPIPQFLMQSSLAAPASFLQYSLHHLQPGVAFPVKTPDH